MGEHIITAILIIAIISTAAILIVGSIVFFCWHVFRKVEAEVANIDKGLLQFLDKKVAK